MAKNSKIAWCHNTWNPWIGCTKLVGGRVEGTLVENDDACFHCYAAELDTNRFSRTLGTGTKVKPVTHWGQGAARHITGTWRDPRKWNKMTAEGQCQNCGILFAPVVVEQLAKESERLHDCPKCKSSEIEYERPRIFCGSLCDWADCEVSDEIRARAFDVIDACPNLDWMLLSKRDQKAVEFLEARYGFKLPKHLWLGFSAGTQLAYDIRQAAMDRLEASVKFFSFEPLFEDIKLRNGFNLAIYGGESGPGARPQNVNFIRNGIAQCRNLGISPFVKQLGARPFVQNILQNTEGMDVAVTSIDLRFKDKKGGDMAEWAEDLRVREFPKIPVDSRG